MTILSKILSRRLNPADKMDGKTFVSAVLVCAGNSTRMGAGKSKQFLELLGKPSVYYTIKAFEESVSVNEIIIVCRSIDKKEFENISSVFSKVTAIVEGGSTRSKSVENGIKATDTRCTHIAVHDGARCLITVAEIEKVVLTGLSLSAAALGVPVKDTVKIVDSENKILDTPDRNTLRAIQTPQVFDKNKYVEFLERANGAAYDFTDDCKLFEFFGETVTVVDGEYTNIKLTTQDDLLIAESILKRRISGG